MLGWDGLCCGRSPVVSVPMKMLPRRGRLRYTQGGMHGGMPLWVVYLCAVGEKEEDGDWCVSCSEVVCAPELGAALGKLTSQMLLVLQACGCPAQVVLDLSGGTRVWERGLLLLLLSLWLLRGVR